MNSLFWETLVFILIVLGKLSLKFVNKMLSYFRIISFFIGISSGSSINTDDLVGSIRIDIIIEEIIFLLAIFGILSFGHVFVK